MKNNKESIVFEKRMNLFRKYRSDINRESINSLDPYSSDLRLIKAKKTINSIDQNILKSINTEIVLSSGDYVNIDFSSNYKMLQFDINNLNGTVISEIEKEFNKINNIQNSYFIFDEENNVLESNIEARKNNELLLNNIEDKINEVSNIIQLFPKTSKEDLEILENSLVIARKKTNPISDDLKVNSENVKPSKDLKKLYFASLFLAIGFLIIVIIMVVLLLVL